MSTNDWLPDAQVVDLSGGRGNGRFSNFLGVILHVNVSGTSNGTSIDFFRNNPAQVCPNFQVYRDGSIVQFLPFNWQPWCQIDGNFNYAAIETGGMPDDPLAPAQVTSVVKILKAYHDRMGLTMRVANSPGERGLGTHQMGGAAWGGHACPGVPRANQRQHLLDLASQNGTLTMDPDVKAAFDALNAKLDTVNSRFLGSDKQHHTVESTVAHVTQGAGYASQKGTLWQRLFRRTDIK